MVLSDQLYVMLCKAKFIVYLPILSIAITTPLHAYQQYLCCAVQITDKLIIFSVRYKYPIE